MYTCISTNDMQNFPFLNLFTSLKYHLSLHVLSWSFFTYQKRHMDIHSRSRTRPFRGAHAELSNMSSMTSPVTSRKASAILHDSLMYLFTVTAFSYGTRILVRKVFPLLVSYFQKPGIYLDFVWWTSHLG